MINKSINKGLLKKIGLFIISNFVVIGGALLFIENKKNTNSYLVNQYDASLKPKNDNVIRFVVGTISMSNSVPLQCKGDSSYSFFGEIFNNTKRVVGLTAFDAKYTLYVNNHAYKLSPFEDTCVVYKTKINYLYPNTSTKAYFEIVNKATSASDVVFDNPTPSNVYFDIETNVKTDENVKYRLEHLVTQPKKVKPISYKGSNYVFVEPLGTIDESIKQAAVGSLIALLLCPIALIIGDKVYSKKKKKKN